MNFGENLNIWGSVHSQHKGHPLSGSLDFQPICCSTGQATGVPQVLKKPQAVVGQKVKSSKDLKTGCQMAGVQNISEKSRTPRCWKTSSRISKLAKLLVLRWKDFTTEGALVSISSSHVAACCWRFLEFVGVCSESWQACSFVSLFEYENYLLGNSLLDRASCKWTISAALTEFHI